MVTPALFNAGRERRTDRSPRQATSPHRLRVRRLFARRRSSWPWLAGASVAPGAWPSVRRWEFREGGGADWEPRAASNGAGATWMAYDIGQRLGVTCSSPCFRWSRALLDGR